MRNTPIEMTLRFIFAYAICRVIYVDSALLHPLVKINWMFSRQYCTNEASEKLAVFIVQDSVSFHFHPGATDYTAQQKKRKAHLKKINHSAVASFRCLAALPHEGGTRAGILPGCPSLDRGSREAELRFTAGQPAKITSNKLQCILRYYSLG
ncbi:hypothetical protein T265_07201 [Opisthorchis viverrini]|uniref:Uncharacterized protein n=1 Tax=Opisthorchis viverrini TaxID=6198 RepID=A0A074ZHT8_OPIVI|nr:hypothetical protein T265_07201 [Opisthorchis viverrini]KER25327.1 hypothetical protein T265_07201 [Opisthorchis viverrini]